MRPQSSLPADYFESMFRAEDDPWQFATSTYEAAKYATTLAALDDKRIYEHGLEVGCANGVFTSHLARHCRKLLAIDISVSALSLAQQRNTDADHVAFEQMQFPQERPTDRFDLIVMSEVVYYWSKDDIRQASVFVEDHLISGGDLLLVHWTGETDYPQSGDEAVWLLRNHLPRLTEERAERTERYRLDLWRNR